VKTSVANDKTKKHTGHVVCINCNYIEAAETQLGADCYEYVHMTDQEWIHYAKEYKPLALIVGWQNGSDVEQAQLRRWLVDGREVPVILVANKRCDVVTAVWALRNQLADYIEWPMESKYLAQRLEELAQRNVFGSFSKSADFGVISRKIYNTQSAVDVIKQRYAEHLSLFALAQCCGLSNVSFSRRFKYEHGISPQIYLRNHRLHIAKKLLTESNMSIKRIAAEVGFDDIAYFSRVFKKVERCSPSQYRDQAWALPATAPISLVQRVEALSTLAKPRRDQRSENPVRLPLRS